jgi:hypothetical protein
MTQSSNRWGRTAPGFDLGRLAEWLEVHLTPEIALLLTILVVAMVPFVRMGAVMSSWGPAGTRYGAVPADRAFAGFGSDTIMMFLGLLI